MDKTNTKMNYEFYAYSWHVDEEYQDETFIRVYGFDDQNKNICVAVNGFRPFVWVELPIHIDWKDAGNKERLYHYFRQSFPGMKCTIKFNKKLYGANLKMNKEGKYTHKMFPFLLCSFSSYKDLKFFPHKLKNSQRIMGLGNLKFRVHGQDACPRLQLTSKYNLPTAGWIKFRGTEILNEEDKFTSCDKEFLVDLRDKRFKPEEIISRSDKTTVPKPLILSFDLEVNSEDMVTMPKATRPGDVIFQISCVFSRLGSHTYDKYLLSLGKPKESIVGAKVLAYSNERKLLMGFRDLVNELNPNVIIGYNIFNFDIPYMMDRTNHKAIYPEWSQQGFPKGKQGIQREIKWSSSAYKNQEFKFLDCEGRLYIDLLPVVQRDFKLNDYKLKTVSTHFIGETKDDLDPKSIFLCYREGIKDDSDTASKYMSICGKYCMQDSMLVIKLMETLNVWYGLSEMAVVCNVPMITLFTKGQQIKVYSNLYKYCLENKIVPEKDGYMVSENERYVGAYVFNPKPGLYENVVPLDFCVDGETLISTPAGTSIKLKNITNRKVYGCNEEYRLDSYNMIGKLQKKGVKDTVKIILQDGREIVTTPDHKFMLEDGSWCEAQNLSNKKIKCGIEQPEDIICSKEEGWQLNVDGYTFNFNTLIERSKTLAFSRILGYVLSDGCIYKRKYGFGSEAYFGTMLDANNFIDDLKLILTTLKYKSIGCRQRTTSKGTCIYVTIPVAITKMFTSLPGVMVGKRASQATTLPKFLMDDNCPLSVVREFLGGLFGGDGTAPYISKARICTISFKWDTIFTWKNDLVKVFHDLKKLLACFELNTTVHEPKNVNAVNFIPKDEHINPRVNCVLSFGIDDVYKFQDKIGFRYCINKSNKLFVISSYQKFQNKVRENFNYALDSVNDLIEKMTIKENLGKTGNISPFEPCLKIVYEQLDKMYTLDSVSYISRTELLYQRGEQKRHADKPRKLSLSPKKFITILDYIEQIGAKDWFATSTKEKKYSVKSDDTTSPTLNFLVKYVVQNGLREVYDIEVDKIHNFIGNGACLHNCSLYPSIIISYNIDYSTCAFDPNIPDDLCHVMEWEDHISCQHDPKVIEKKRLTKTIDELTSKKKYDKALVSELRKKRSDITKSLNKNVMCEKRKYRFLKTTEEYPEFKGILPTIVQSLLDARKDTRKEMSKLKDSLKTITDEHERKEVETTMSILNQRQLAYKVSANSMYGITGVKAGMLPFMPVAMSITYMGRENILKAAEYGKNKFNGQLIYIDTDCLLENSPVLIKHKNKIFYTTVDKLSQGDWERINENKEISTPKDGYMIWSDQGFTKIENVVRCKPIESMSRVTTHIGTVICSDNHSLLTETLECVTPQEVGIGDKLCVTTLPLPDDTPKEPLFPNKLTAQKINDYVIPQFKYKDLTADLAFVWGLFMADGSCGKYKCKLKNGNFYNKYSWAINKADTDLLDRARQILQEEYGREFQILDTAESSGCFKLVQCKCDNNMVDCYRDLFYHENLKKIPDIVLQAPLEIREAFFIGFYAGDGSKKNPSINITFKGQIGSAQLFYLMKSIGYQVSVNVREDKPDIYKLTGSTPLCKMRKVPNAIKKITEYKDRGTYIYDIQTGNHHFAAGIGQVVVHNSNYFSFPHIKDHKELWDYAIKVADEISSLFPPPMKLEFEEAVYTKFLILTKKRYMYQTALKDGNIKPEIGKRGVVLNRRDNSAFIRTTYENMVKIIFEHIGSLENLQSKVISSLIDDINLMFNNGLETDQFVITKSTGDYGNLQPQYFLNEKGLHKAMLGQYNVPFLTEEIQEKEGILTPQEEMDWYLDKLPAHIQLLEKVRRRGQMRNEGSRLEYVIVETDDLKAKQSAKIETVNYYTKNKGILNLDYLYYLQRLINPVDQILEVVFNLKDFMKNHYNHRLLKKKLTIQINKLFSPIFDIEMDKLYLVKIKTKYFIISGSKELAKQELEKMEENDACRLIFETLYVPSTSDLYSMLKNKYGPDSTLKTKFEFVDNYILLGNMSEEKLISTIKKECKG